MDTASFGGFLRTLLIIAVLYYVFKFAMRYLFPIFVYKMAKKAGEGFQKQQQEFYQQQNTKTHSDSKYNQQQNKSEKVPRSTKVVGEYIDFEEIDK
jgi:hypothetical protein